MIAMREKSKRILEYGRIREELSRFCVSRVAKNRALELDMMEDERQIERELDFSEEAFNIIMKFPNIRLNALLDIGESLKIAEMKGMLSAAELLAIAQTLRSSTLFARAIKNASSEDVKIDNFMEVSSFIASFSRIEEAIFGAILSEEEISDKASKKLFSIRRAIESKKLSIRNKLEQIISSADMGKYLQESIITLRGDRFVIPVKSEYKSRVDGIVHDKSKGGSTFFIEPSALVNMNNELRALLIDEQDEIRRILMELSAMVAADVDAIRLSYESVCELDYAFAKGRYAHELNATRPLISEPGVIKIRQGRHPFIDSKVVVPIDFEVGTTYSAVIITGPNTGGKTVSLKTVALLTMMALSGLFVPCLSGSKFGLFKEIYSDIGDEQSIDLSLSTFSSHMKNIVEMVEIASTDTLLLFDELGAGTDPTEGAALAIAILSTVKDKGATVIATTHYAELKHFALVSPGFQNASVEFDVEKLMPTYRLSIGSPGKSNAFEISKRLGLEERIINKARNLISGEDIKFEDVLTKIEENKSYAEKARMEAEAYKKESEELLKKLEERDEKSFNMRDKLINDAKAEARRIIASAKLTVDETLKDLKNLETNVSSSREALDIKQRLSSEEKKNYQKMPEISQEGGEIPKKLVIGRDYFVTSLGKSATLMGIDEAKGEVKVKAGIMSLFVDKSELRVASKRKEKKLGLYDAKNPSVYGTELNVVRAGKMEIDLHGKDVLQALHELEKFLDEAVISNLNNLSVIHGLGSGVLKRNVQDYLKKHPQVKRIRPGGMGEGGAGVTIVTLK